MQVSDYSFEHLPLSKLFKTYVRNFEKLSDFYAANPFNSDAIAQKIDQFQFQGNRRKAAEIFTSFNQQFDVHQNAFDNLDRLKDNGALAIVTGQQLGIYGGPLYTMLKIVSVIHLAEQLEQEHGRPVIPFFWLADEDHDYEEVRGLNILADNEVKNFALPSRGNHLPAVAEMSLPEQLQELRSHLRDSLYDTDFSDELWELLDQSFQKGNTFVKSFGLFVSKLFSKHGLVLAGSNHPKVKKATGTYLKQSIAEADAIRKYLEEQSHKLDDQFHQQVTLYDSNLFYLDEEAGRTKISRNGDVWQTDAGGEWSNQELIQEIEEQPEKFSPNVFLRPVLQDGLLPTLGYIAGPGETAYYGQMKKFYSCFDLDMPVIFPRLSATMIEPAIDRIMNELPFDLFEYSNRIEDLESEYVDRTEQHDIEAIFDEWKKQVEQTADSKKDEVTKIDSTLNGAVEKAKSGYFGELDKLKGKVYRAVKKQDEIQLKRIRRVKTNLFPQDSLQERVIASIFYMNKYGVDIWDELLDALNDDEQLDHHKLIYL